MAFLMTNGIENANTPTATPTAPQIIDCRAPATLVGSPWAVKNWNPATRNIITANPIKIGQIRFNMALIKVTISKFCADPGVGPGSISAKPTNGDAIRKANVDIIANFLLIKVID